MNLISATDLKAKLDRGDDFKLVMVLGDLAFQGKHIPQSLNISSMNNITQQLSPDDEIVVYCSGPSCPASLMAYQMLTQAGFSKVKRYAGGLEEWESLAYPLEGALVSGD